MSMAPRNVEADLVFAASNHDVWRAYRNAFERFSRQVQHVQKLTEHPSQNRAEIDKALLELEKARAEYDACRDTLAEQMLPAASRDGFLAAADSPRANAERVRAIAKLLWEAAGKPAGTAQDDWRRAEEIMQRAAKEAA